MSGPRRERRHAKEYLQWLLQSKDGPMRIQTDGRDDVTVVNVPKDCVGYITGQNRETLSRVEESNGVMTLFINSNVKAGSHGLTSAPEELAIFGPQRGRCGAELMIGLLY
eukprot:gnl/TRDRNA2_/TRDRNA2_169641_c1_seq3.p1 gnl/TRDRNA2_/TRDRNA2_169641_c1~~gnl/TRDRNA2_/TRDRNA2_169641_c1_seq3.p1  ORF type:complete len:110 (-),score=14.18 gnl/TRDRNA2_/TRDRNA2_169641_c1_seq3:51-380(-)